MAERSLNILFATPRFFPAQGGVENHVYQVATRLAARGHRATVFTTNDDGALGPSDTIEGVTIRRFNHLPRRSDAFLSPDLYRAIAREGGKFDALHVQNYLTFVSPLAMLAANRAGLPYVVTFHGGGHSQSWRNAIRRAQGLLLRPLLMRASRLIATARFEVDYYGKRLGLPATKFQFVSNGCDIAVRSVEVATDPNLIISIGRLERYKGHQHVLAAFPDVLKRMPDARLRILGDGPYKTELERMRDALGLTERVTIGAVPIAERQRMAELLSSAAVVALMSEFETQPMAALEAIALGRPVVVADTSGLSELAAQGYARAVPLNAQPAQVAGALLAQIAAGPKPTAALKLPTWDDCVRDLIVLYGQIGRGSGAAARRQLA
jgi:glycosyltransferase involved in cell wall biosynthesis